MPHGYLERRHNAIYCNILWHLRRHEKVENVLVRFEMQDCKPAATPLESKGYIYIYIYILYIGRNPNERELFHINEKLKESGNISASELTLLENKKTALIAEVTGLSLGEHT